MRIAKLLALPVALMLASVALVGTASGKDGIPALPPNAVKVDEDTYYVGKKMVDGIELEGYAFVHRRENAKSQAKGKPGGSCYSLLASGAKWKAVEPFNVDAASAPSSVGSSMTSLMNTDVGTWESGAGANIFGSGSTNNGYNANLNSVDGANGAEFAPISNPGVIAVTYTWGFFGGPPPQRELVEWDMIFDSDDFTWSTSGAAGAMDFRNIDTHELGHAMGLGHPSNSCTEETMYAYASEGETKKRDLNAGDIAGINALY